MVVGSARCGRADHWSPGGAWHVVVVVVVLVVFSQVCEAVEIHWKQQMMIEVSCFGLYDVHPEVGRN